MFFDEDAYVDNGLSKVQAMAYFDARLSEAQAIAAKMQPRQAADVPNRRALPHASPTCEQRSLLLQKLPLDCRLLIWECVLQPSQTRIERWQYGDNNPFFSPEVIDADCFPYRITTSRSMKSEKLLSLILSCRQLYLEGLSILYSTAFVFEMPRDLYSFQKCVSPEGVSSVGSIAVAFGQCDLPGCGPFFSVDVDNSHPYGSIEEWEGAICGLKNMKGLNTLQVWLGHRHTRKPYQERRPWKEHKEDDLFEHRHNKLFELFGTVDVPKFTLHLTWNPEDLLSRRKWPFEVKLHTKDEMIHTIDHELAQKTYPDLCTW